MNWTQCTPALPDMLCLSRQVPGRITESLHFWSDLCNCPLPRTRVPARRARAMPSNPGIVRMVAF